MSSTRQDRPTGDCHDCGSTFLLRDMSRHRVPMDIPSASGYEMVRVPLCYRCSRQRFGWDCPQCGCVHDTREDAKYCCQRQPGEAPDCIECGRRMERKAWGYTADGKPTVEWAECEACPIGWGRFTGWHKLDSEGGESA